LKTTWIEPSSFVIGWLAVVERSTIARRRKARPTSRCGDSQSPSPSGPRWTIVSRMRARTSGSTGCAAEVESQPTIPHMFDALR